MPKLSILHECMRLFTTERGNQAYDKHIKAYVVCLSVLWRRIEVV